MDLVSEISQAQCSTGATTSATSKSPQLLALWELFQNSSGKRGSAGVCVKGIWEVKRGGLRLTDVMQWWRKVELTLAV